MNKGDKNDKKSKLAEALRQNLLRRKVSEKQEQNKIFVEGSENKNKKD
jgi:hypothetical protein